MLKAAASSGTYLRVFDLQWMFIEGKMGRVFFFKQKGISYYLNVLRHADSGTCINDDERRDETVAVQELRTK